MFIDENTVLNIVGTFLQGVNDIDSGAVMENGFLLPYVKDPKMSWIEYRCAVSIELDPGIVLHKILPQTPQQIDTLASGTFDPAQTPNIQGTLQQSNFTGQQGQAQAFDENTAQANTLSVGRYTDFVQRMATSDYRFCLKGWAVRIGFKIPIPGLKVVCGVPAIPDKQCVLSDSEVIANYSGVPVYFSQWELWYFIAVPPTKVQLPPPNVAEHIRADAVLPRGMQVPLSMADSVSVPSGPAPVLQRVAPQR